MYTYGILWKTADFLRCTLDRIVGNNYSTDNRTAPHRTALHRTAPLDFFFFIRAEPQCVIDS